MKTAGDVDVVAGIDLLPNFVSWEFTWTDGTDVGSVDNTTGAFTQPFNEFVVNAAYVITATVLCTDDCILGVQTVGMDLVLWNACEPPGGICIGALPGSNLATQLVTWSTGVSVPEPSTLGLLGAGLLVLFARRRKTA